MMTSAEKATVVLAAPAEPSDRIYAPTVGRTKHPWPIGPRLTRPHGYRVAGSTIQIIEQPRSHADRRWRVVVFLADLHVDRRFRQQFFASKARALRAARACAMRRVPRARIESWCGHWLATNGTSSITIMVVPCV